MEAIIEKEYIFIFNSIHRVMKAERILKEKGIKFLLIPVPRQLTSDCGLSIKYTGNDCEVVKKELIAQFADKMLVYEKVDEGYKKIL